jgi:four helix bundle protein
MTTIKNFEDLKAWQKAREMAGYIYALTRKQKFSRDFGLCNQIQEAAGSTMHNIAEGFESGYDPEFVRFLKMARRSAGEVQSGFIWLWMLTSLPKKNLKRLTILQLTSKN